MSLVLVPKVLEGFRDVFFFLNIHLIYQIEFECMVSEALIKMSEVISIYKRRSDSLTYT